jgi:hypothetical protein
LPIDLLAKRACRVRPALPSSSSPPAILVPLGCVYPFQADFNLADAQSIAIHDVRDGADNCVVRQRRQGGSEQDDGSQERSLKMECAKGVTMDAPTRFVQQTGMRASCLWHGHALLCSLRLHLNLCAGLAFASKLE